MIRPDSLLTESNDSRPFLFGSKHPAQGQFVTTGPQMGGSADTHMGYCVQVREGAGDYGSNLVLLRHPSGALTPHENQGFFPLTPAEEALARPLFVALPEDEDYASGYTLQGAFPEIGFLIGRAVAPAAGAGTREMVAAEHDDLPF